MNGLRLWLVSLAFATTTNALAQQGGVPARANVQELGRIAAEQDQNYRIKRSEAISLAQKNGWVIEKTYQDGRHVSLQGLDAAGVPVYYITYNNSAAAATTRTDQLWAGGSLGLNLSGASNSVNEKLGVWDGGMVRESHVELRGRVVQKDNVTKLNDHATHVAGTMIASGQNSLARGMAFGVKKLHAYDFNNNTSEMAVAAQEQMLISNHSYGTIAGWHYNTERKGTDEDPSWEWWGYSEISETEDYKFGYYDETTASWDRIAYNAPYFLIVKSGGNNRGQRGPAVGRPFMKRNASGNFTLVKERPENISSNDSYDGISTYGNAKNILTVGAVNAITTGYNQPADVSISTFSSFGPTDDGRIKPDLVGNGVAVLSTTSQSDKSYAALSGTSMSAPNVSGTLLLLQEHYASLNQGKLMRAATLKGLAIHTTDEAGTAPGPDYIFGWGLLNAERAANVITNAQQTHLIMENTLAQGQVFTKDITASGTGPLTVTISWTDPDGKPLPLAPTVLNNRSPRLVNDLDLRITANGTTSMPWILDPEKPAQAATRGDNIRDNVEQIVILNAAPGQTYTITISHKGTLQQGPQAYSLIASGVGGQNYCASAPSSDAGARINKLVFDGKTTTFDGCATYRNQMGTVLSFEPSQTKTLTFELGSCGAASSKIAKVFVDWNSNGSFEDAGEEIAVSGVLNGTGIFIVPVTAPSSVKTGHSTRLRVITSETTDASSISPCGSYTRGETQDYTIHFVKPATDIALQNVVPSGASLCAGTTQVFMVRLRNNGMSPQANIPVRLSVRRNGSEVAAISGMYTRSLQPFEEDELMLTGNFATEVGATYELVATSSLAQDAVSSNNQATRIYGVGGGSAAPQAVVATRCGTQPSFTLTGSSNAGTIYWYKTPTGGLPVAAGNTTSVPSNQVDGKLYAALNDFAATIGPATKGFASDGGYNQFSPDVVVSTKAPVVLESARLYIGNSGKITFTVLNEDGAPVSIKTLNVKATRSTPAPGVQPNDPNDQGEIYSLGLELPEAGTYRIAISYGNDATIFRNNAGVTGYPFGLPNVVSIIGNTATTASETYYYYFYDLKVRAIGCSSPRVEVPLETGTPISMPVVTREGHDLKSSAPDGNQWYLNGKAIPDATGQLFTPTESGNYSVQAQWMGCVSVQSQSYTYAFQADGRELKKELVASPNPSSGIFKVQVETDQREDVQFDVTDMMGNLIYTAKAERFNGFYESNIDLSNRASGIYLLRVRFGGQTQTQKLVLQR